MRRWTPRASAEPSGSVGCPQPCSIPNGCRDGAIMPRCGGRSSFGPTLAWLRLVVYADGSHVLLDHVVGYACFRIRARKLPEVDNLLGSKRTGEHFRRVDGEPTRASQACAALVPPELPKRDASPLIVIVGRRTGSMVQDATEAGNPLAAQLERSCDHAHLRSRTRRVYPSDLLCRERARSLLTHFVVRA